MSSTVDVARIEEHEESGQLLHSKLQALAMMIDKAEYTVFYTGAGVSTSSGVGDYRGPTGLWTMRRYRQLELAAKARALDEEEQAEFNKLASEIDKKKAQGGQKVGMMDAQPSPTHMAMATLIRLQKAHYVVTTNLDGIHRKSGLKAHSQLCNLHGDVYVERCTACGEDFERNYHVRRPRLGVHDHTVPDPCESCGSRNRGKKVVGTQDKNIGTKDTHINFGEYLCQADWKEAEEHCGKADLCIVAGTSMSLRHITHFPFMAKKTVIINLQATPDDKRCDLRIYAQCDAVFGELMRLLGLAIDPIPVWRPQHAKPLKSLPGWLDMEYRQAAKRLEEMAQYRAEGLGLVPKENTPEVAPSLEAKCGEPISQRGNAFFAQLPSTLQQLPTHVRLVQTYETTATLADRNAHRWGLCLAVPDGFPCPIEDFVDKVEYILHQTFTPSRVTVRAPFRLTRIGWGTFTVRFRIYFKGGLGEASERPLEGSHVLSFAQPCCVTTAQVPQMKLAEGFKHSLLSSARLLRRATTRVTRTDGSTFMEQTERGTFALPVFQSVSVGA